MVKVVWILGPPTLPTRRLIFGLMVAIFCHPRVGNTHTWVIHANIGPIIHKILLGSIIVVMMVRVEVMLLLGPTTYTPKNIMLAYTGMIGGLFHISVIAQHPQYFHNWLGVIQRMLLPIIHLVMVMVMVNVVWVLIPPNLLSNTKQWNIYILITYIQ